MRRCFVIIVLAVSCTAASFLAGCGSTNDTESGANPAAALYGYLNGIVTRANVGNPDLAPVVSAACASYADGLADRGGDTSSFDQFIADLFDTNDGGVDQEQLDRAITDACGSFDGDVRRFAADLSAALGVDLDSLRGYIATACADFRQRRALNAPYVDQPEPFDPLIGSVFAKGGLDQTDMEALVQAACRDVPIPETPESPTILPDPALTSGDPTAPGDLTTWCEPGYAAAYPPLTEAARDSVLDAYEVPTDERASYEVMRLIPIGLGGTNAETNLFPVARRLVAQGGPNATDKAEIDQGLTEKVCASTYDLETARVNLISNWPVALAQTIGPGGG